MEQPDAKRHKTAAVISQKEKVQNLPLLCVESICKFTQTSKLICLYSEAVPLPGAFWNFGVEAVLKKRLPLSISDDLPYHQPGVDIALLDAAGAKVASIKRPRAFRFSPLRVLVESTVLTVHAKAASSVNYEDGLQLYVVHGKALLSHLPKVSKLTLSVRDLDSNVQFASGDRLERSIKHLVPQLRFFEIKLSDRALAGLDPPFFEENALSDFVRAISVHEMVQLRHLALPPAIFNAALRAFDDPSMHAAAQGFLADLSSASVWHRKSLATPDAWYVESSVPSRLSTRCRQLSQLRIAVHTDFGIYLAAFRSLPGLTSLGLYLGDVRLKGLVFDDNSTVRSVLDLRMTCKPNSTSFAVASLFPNAKALALEQFVYSSEPLDLASEFCARKVVPNVEKLSCFNSRMRSASSSDSVAQFLAIPDLPEAIDLSQIVFENLARDAGLLAAIFVAVKQSNAVKKLLMRGPVHREALARLQSYIDLSNEVVKVTAWKDRDLGEQPGLPNLTQVSQQTDFKIVGTKPSGNLKGQEFTIRIVHQLSKRFDIFD